MGLWNREEELRYVAVRTFGDAGMKYQPGMEFPADSERFNELLEGGYIEEAAEDEDNDS